MEPLRQGNAEPQRLEDSSFAPAQLSAIETDESIVEQSAADVQSPTSPLRSIAQAFALKPVQLAVAFVLVFGVMSWIEFGGPAILDNDGYYHIRWSKMLRESFPRLPAFKALPLTTLNEHDYVDHHYLFHVMLFPFTFGDLVTGAKVAASLFSSLALVALFALLVTYNVRWRWLWLLPLVASSDPFLYRMAMTRAPALSLAMLGVGAYLILKRKHILLGLLSFAFVWCYSLFPLIFLFALAYTVTIYLTERRIEWRGAAASLVGIILGLAINPYFPKNLKLLYEHILMKATPGSEYEVGVGMEWYPYYSWDLLTSSAIAFAIYFIALAAFDFRKRARDVKPLFFLIISAGLLLMAIKSRRFVEYWPPFAILFAAFTISPQLERINFSWLARTRDRAIAAVAAALVVVILSIGMTSMVYGARRGMKDAQGTRNEADSKSYWPDIYRRPGLWIAEHVPPGAMIFNTDWDDFPMLFHYSPNHRYISGLDPTYLHDRDKNLWKLYADITMGKVSDPAPLIREKFGAEYVFTDISYHYDFLEVVDESGDFERVYEDDYTTVLRILSPEEKAAKGKSDTK